MLTQTVNFKGYGISASATQVAVTVDDEVVYQGPVWSVTQHQAPSLDEVYQNNLWSLTVSPAGTWNKNVSIAVSEGDLYLHSHWCSFEGTYTNRDEILSIAPGTPTILFSEIIDDKPYGDPKQDVRIDGIPQNKDIIIADQQFGEWSYKITSGSTMTYVLRSSFAFTGNTKPE